MSYRSYTEGVLRVWHDDETRTVNTYDELGVLVSSDPYTPEQNATADAEAAEAAVQAALDFQRTAVKAIVTELQDEKDRCQIVIAKDNNQIDGGDTKNVARAAKRIADAAIDLAKLVDGRV